MRIFAAFVWFLALAASFAAHAQDAGQNAIGEERSPPMLAGPSIDGSSVRSIVRHDTSGRLIRVEGRPEEAALLQIRLTPATRDAARAVTVDRALRVGEVLIEHVDTVREATDALTRGEGERARQLTLALRAHVDPEPSRCPLLTPLAAVLSPDEHRELVTIVDEYWDAWILSEATPASDRMEDRMDRAAPALSAERRARIESRLSESLFQQEVRQAYERTLRPVRDRLERIYELAEPTAEQREAIRDAVVAHVRDTRLRPDQEARQALAERVYAILTEEQRIRLLAASLF
jgi:hypothetical protein